jgi:hypothetical protein
MWLDNVPEYTIIFCRMLLLRNLIEQLYIPMMNAISAQGNIKLFQIVNSVLNLIPIFVSYLFFHFGYPPYYLYSSFFIFSLVQLFLVLYFSKINLNFPVFDFYKYAVEKSILPFLISIVIAFTPSYFISSSFLQLFTVTSVSIISFLLSIYFVGLDNFEKEFIKKSFLKINYMLHR